MGAYGIQQQYAVKVLIFRKHNGRYRHYGLVQLIPVFISA